MKILLLGANGQLGWQLRRSLCVVGEVTALHRGSAPLSGDLARPEELGRSVDAVSPDVIVNAAAYTAVDRAETERDAAFAINASACSVLAQAAQRCGAWLIHYSTDYVFDGSGERPWRESDPTAPINVYGSSKLAGEHAIAQACERHLILRTSWVFDSWGQNFLKSILRAAARQDSLNVVSDQWGAPTRAALIADVTAHILGGLVMPGLTRHPSWRASPAATWMPDQVRHDRSGIYHLAAAGATTWHEYAVLAVAHARECGMVLKASPESIGAIRSSEYPQAAARPGNSRLDTSRLRATFGINLPQWQDGVRAVVAELAAKN
jgi:dTDP-4-dehydrorhamnose reductase